MLRRLRARAIDGATMLARYIDARRERDRLRALVDAVADERDEARRERDDYARLVATREVEIDELLRLRREVERLTAERDEYAQGVSILACRIDRVQQERDARIPTDIDGAQAWAEAHGMAVGHDHAGWHCRDEHDGGMVAGGGRAWVVGQAVGRVLSRTWRGDA